MLKKRFRPFGLCFIILSFLIIFSLNSCTVAGSDTVYPKHTLLENMNRDISEEYNSAWKYLDKWDFPKFSSYRFQELEAIFEDKYYKDIPDPLTAAKKTAEKFLEEYYDGTELGNEDAVTEALLNCYTKAVGDKYSVYRTPVEYGDYSGNMSGNYIGIGITVTKLVEGESDIIHVIEVSEGSSAQAAGILPDDRIVRINGTAVADVGYDKAVDLILGEEGSTVYLGIIRGSKPLNVSAVRKKIEEKSVTYSLDDGIGYIRIKSFKANTASQFKEAIDHMKANGARGIIYDVRDNGGGYLSAVESMLDYIAPDGIKLVSFSNDYGEPYYSGDSHSFSLPSVVICNKNTASAAELFCHGVRDLSDMGYFAASVVGVTTHGKGIMQATYHLSDGSTVTLTVAYYNPPLGKNYHEVGIKPDRIVKMTESGDAQLDAARLEIVSLIGSGGN